VSGVPGPGAITPETRRRDVRAATPKTTGTPTVQIDSASVFYGEVVGLSHATFGLHPGITGVVGPNGSGKTTLMRALTGLILPQEGTVEVLGKSPFRSAEVRAQMTFVPSLESFHEALSGRKNLEVAFLAQGRVRAEAKDLAVKALDLVRLTKDGDRRYGRWSRGMRQRLKLGLALAGESKVVLLDEPFLGVDPPSRQVLKEHILALARAGRTVLVSSHVLHEVESLTRLVGVLAHGRLLGFGLVDSLLRDLRDKHPHRVSLSADDPRRIGTALLGRPHVREVQVAGQHAVIFVTDDPEAAYRELATIVMETGVPIRRVETLDNTLEAVFTHVTAAGTRRL